MAAAISAILAPTAILRTIAHAPLPTLDAFPRPRSRKMPESRSGTSLRHWQLRDLWACNARPSEARRKWRALVPAMSTWGYPGNPTVLPLGVGGGNSDG